MSKMSLSSIRFGSPYCTFRRLPLGNRHFSVLHRSCFPIDLSLYLVTNRCYTKDDSHFIDKVLQTVHGGVTCVQYSDPYVDLHNQFKTALSLREKLRASGVPLIINNNVEVALAVQADGVHLGQKDLAYGHARRLIGSRAIIGLTVDTWDDVLKAEELDVDYLGVQIFPSKHTKPTSLSIWGLEGLRKIRAISKHRIVAIGGINLDNLLHVYKELNINEKSDGIAMVGELWRTSDPKMAAKRVMDLFHKFSVDKMRDHASL